MMKKFNTILLDFGGVLYDIDYDKSRIRLAELSDTPEIFLNMPHSKFFDFPHEFEIGKISANEFRSNLRKWYNINADDVAIDSAWNAMLLGLKPDAEWFLEQLSNDFQLYLLSNTNEIHYNAFIGETNKILKQFNKTYFSHLIKMRKPNEDIFKYFLSDSQNISKDVLFIDDSDLNIFSAKMLDFFTIMHKRNSKLSDLLHTIKILSQSL